MNRLPDLINIAKCNIFANPVSFNNCLGKFSISKLLGFPMITVGASYSLTKICVHTQGLQMNEINVIAKHIKPWYQTMHCIHTYKKSSPFRKWNMLHWIKEGHCEFYNTYITQALLISDNKCSFFAKPTKRWKSCSGVNHFYIPLFNKTTGLEENTNEIDLIIQEHFLRTLQKQTSQIFLM